jgi:hypothetical protein
MSPAVIVTNALPKQTIFRSGAHLLNVGGDIDGGSTSAMAGSLHVTRSLLVR